MKEGNVLVVEDDQDLRELVVLYLEKYGFLTREAGNGEQCLAWLSEQPFDAIVMDVMLPDASGVELCQQIRQTSDIPILFVSRRRESDDIILGLEMGGDDYLTKPFDPNVLVARVKANVRRMGKEKLGDTTFKLDDIRFWRYKSLEVDLDTYSVRVNGNPVSLFAKELQLLLFFVRHPNKVFSFDQLLDQVWGNDHIRDERTVMVQISNLRKKIEEDSTKPQFIKTVRGFGYKFEKEG